MRSIGEHSRIPLSRLPAFLSSWGDLMYARGNRFADAGDSVIRFRWVDHRHLWYEREFRRFV